ncbi:MAG: hypothetical protein OQK35_00280 [Alphaproteobacteria bacterium]|nr:hypothetical protein [Rhodospirillales bacterium]MCW9044746.1 hypothetical protein [Alphaproteobacteria bacterium]
MTRTYLLFVYAIIQLDDDILQVDHLVSEGANLPHDFLGEKGLN